MKEIQRKKNEYFQLKKDSVNDKEYFTRRIQSNQQNLDSTKKWVQDLNSKLSEH